MQNAARSSPEVIDFLLSKGSWSQTVTVTQRQRKSDTKHVCVCVVRACVRRVRATLQECI
jgi:hypothetical protein